VSKVPSLPYPKIIAAFERDGWVQVRQKGSHIRLEKRITTGETLKITVPAHRPVKRSTLARILKQARTELDYFLGLL
jgi:predicted RNA binding protein YcfA (HicA-like mRNA interferase family)